MIVEGEGYRLIRGDCLEVMANMPDASVNLIATDPPYFRVKDEPWDRQWDSRDAFLAWMGRVADEWRRILKPNGSLYVFASPQMAWYVEGVIRERFEILNSITWNKPGQSYAEVYGAESFRTFVYMSERIIFAEQVEADAIAAEESGYYAEYGESKRQLRSTVMAEYLKSEFNRSQVSQGEIALLFPSKTGNKTGCVSNWLLGYNIPTESQYQTIRHYLNSKNCAKYLELEWNELKRKYEQIRTQFEGERNKYSHLHAKYEDLRRPFNATPDTPYTDVWTFPTVQTYPGKHPCEKPLAMMEHIVGLSSRPGDVVLDCFFGSNTTGVAARNLGREYIGIEMSEHWHGKGHRRLIDASRAARGLPKQLTDTATHTDLPLFAEVQA